MSVNQIFGDSGNNNLTGTGGADLIYGFSPTDPAGATISMSRVASGLSQPVFAAAPPDDVSHLFVVERTGKIKVLDPSSHEILTTPFLDVSSQILTDGERGLLGFAFDPNYAANHFVYVDLINTSGNTEIRRYTTSSTNPYQVDASTMTPIITIQQETFNNHKAGWIGFGPDGDLYIATGDGGSGGDPHNNAQNANVLLGKMLRIDVHQDDFPTDAMRNYAIPADNPFAGPGVAGADEIYDLGLRNPFRDSFDRVTGDFYIADVGQDMWEEIDVGARGANYGWNVFEGPATFSNNTLGPGTLTAPIFSYNHSVGHAIIGGYVYRGDEGVLQSQYFYADEINSKMFTLHFDGTNWVSTEITGKLSFDASSLQNPTSFAEDGRGDLYVMNLQGDVFKISTGTNNEGNDTLNGLAGDDVMNGGGGNDTLNGGPGNDVLHDSTGADTLVGGDDNDILLAGPFAHGQDAFTDVLNGGNGNDILVGDAGSDILTGGAQSDRFVFDAGALADAQAIGPTLVDTLTDYDQGNTGAFSAAEGDVIDISSVTGSALDGGQAASAVARVIDRSGDVVLQVDADGATNGSAWTTIAHLNGLHVGENVQAVLGMLAAGGTSLPVHGSFAGFGDFNGDGATDLLWRNDNGATAIWQMNGGSVQTAVFPGGADNSWHIAGVADLNGDSTSDILWRNDSGSTVEWLMANSALQSAVPVSTTHNTPQWTVVGVVDADANGNSIFWRSDNGNGASTYAFGENTIQAPGGVGGNLSNTFGVAGTGDFNGDGHPDLLFRSQTDGSVVAWLMNGATVQSAVFTSGAGLDWHVAGVGDFNNDGIDDLFWHNDNGGNAVWLMNSSGTRQQSAFFNGVGNDWHAVGTADVNGDHRDDVIWRNDNGSTAAWLMNGVNAPTRCFPAAPRPTG